VNDMRFLAPVFPGHTLVMEIKIIKMTEGAALIEGSATVDDTVTARGKLSFARLTV
jgi:3-hydroxymyristoyl/3-hydroxydecanoyl-(acyl carrier protein) dehydratase